MRSKKIIKNKIVYYPVLNEDIYVILVNLGKALYLVRSYTNEPDQISKSNGLLTPEILKKAYKAWDSRGMSVYTTEPMTKFTIEDEI